MLPKTWLSHILKWWMNPLHRLKVLGKWVVFDAANAFFVIHLALKDQAQFTFMWQNLQSMFAKVSLNFLVNSPIGWPGFSTSATTLWYWKLVLCRWCPFSWQDRKLSLSSDGFSGHQPPWQDLLMNPNELLGAITKLGSWDYVVYSQFSVPRAVRKQCYFLSSSLGVYSNLGEIMYQHSASYSIWIKPSFSVLWSAPYQQAAFAAV